ncbi:acyltransferase [Luteimonas sp. MC1825]|nr:acyltransferase [Luteimonas sp. MC1825]
MVLLFHYGFGVPGGYVGVDVFFVISGFLITGIITRQMEKGEFSFLEFYERRARRILPALFVVLIISSIGALFVLLPSDLERFAKSLIASLLSVSNFWFWSQGGYFGSASEMAPLLHTWSLAVEEQFYIALPLALFLVYRWAPRHVFSFTAGVTVVTFIAAAFFVSTRTPEVFYFSPFRAWELSLGGLLAVRRPPAVTSKFHRQWIAAAGLLLVVVPAVAFNEETLFPGPSAALPCLGTALLIWTGMSGDSVVRRILATRLLVLVGLISYSLYLWHWPILVLAKHAVGQDLGLVSRLVLGGLAFVMAFLSWKFVETPFRNRGRTSGRVLWLSTLGAGAALAVASGVTLSNGGFERRFDPQVVTLDRARARQAFRTECIDYRPRVEAVSACKIGAAGVPTLLVWGDSYAHAMLPALDTALKNLGVAALFVAESGCPPLPQAVVSWKGRENWRCQQFNRDVMRLLTDSHRLEHLVLAAAWNAYAAEDQGYKLRVAGSDTSEDSLKRGLVELTYDLGEQTAVERIVFIGQVPSYEWSIPTRMLDANRWDVALGSLTREAWRAKSEASHAAVRGLVGSGAFQFIDPSEWFCRSGVCQYADQANLPFYWDHGHINSRGSAFILPQLEQGLRKVLADQGAISLRASP